MDPYLESRWSDVHATLITLLKEAIQPKLPANLRARSEEGILLEDDENDEDAPLASTRYRSDIAVVELPRDVRSAATSRPSSSVREPYLINLTDGPDFDRFVQIIDTSSGNRVVSAIEILSPWNKEPGRLNAKYCKKVDDYARGGVSFLELDLLRSARKWLPVDRADLPVEGRTAYLACVRRAWTPRQWQVYPIRLREPLPSIPVPLRRKDADLNVDLQPLIERVYVAGGHDDIDYSKPPDPPLSKEDEAWANELLTAAGKR
jgi:hypothetical protein